MDLSGSIFLKMKNFISPLKFEIFAWAFSALTFVIIYCFKFSASITVAPSYLLNILALWMGISALRAITWLSFTKTDTPDKKPTNKAQRLIASILITLPLTAIYLWHIAIIASLLTWKTIITWDIALPYLKNFTNTKDALELPSWIFYSLGLLIAIAQIATYKKIEHIDIFFKSRKIPKLKSALLITGFSLIFLIQISRLINHEQMHTQEPIGLSLFRAFSSQLQSHEIKENPELENLEKKSRASYSKNPSNENRNLILIIGDALRSDHMGIYGYYRNTTPRLSKSAKAQQTLLAKGTRSTCAESTCGILSLISSRPLRFIPKNPLTLHEVLHLNDYRTILILSGDHTNFYGLKKLYGTVDEYYDATSTEKYTNDDEAVIEKARTLPSFDKKTPVMLHFHLMSAHGLGNRKKEHLIYQPSSNYYKFSSQTRQTKTSQEDIEAATNYYDNGVLQLDYVVSTLLTILKEKGYLENATVAITGDHGEMLGEHNLFGHQRTVEEGVLKVPFIVQRYGYRGVDFGDWHITSQTDIAPTLLEELRLPTPSAWQGIALQNKAFPRTIYFQQESQKGIYWQSNREIIKYWKDEKTQNEFAYKINTDKEEKNNIAKLIPNETLKKLELENIKINQK